MDTYEVTCSCGHVMKVDAANKKEAISKIKDMMDETAIAKHWQEKHPGEAMPSVGSVHRMIEKGLMPASVTV